MNDSRFSNYTAFAAYLVSSGMVAEGKAEDVKCALAAFVMEERRRAVEDARKAVIKALDKAR